MPKDKLLIYKEVKLILERGRSLMIQEVFGFDTGSQMPSHIFLKVHNQPVVSAQNDPWKHKPAEDAFSIYRDSIGHRRLNRN